MVQETKYSYTKKSPNNGNENSKDYSIKIKHSSSCIDIKATLKELDV